MHSCMCLITSALGESSSFRSLTSNISSATSRLSLSAGLPYSLIFPSRLSTKIITYPFNSTTCFPEDDEVCGPATAVLCCILSKQTRQSLLPFHLIGTNLLLIFSFVAFLT
uniref:(northern house mosquito) hypothetical protein n=1 Tax=Culex pipiens TaxID=7175 RepID=A0A8D8DKF4_CULPI